MTLRIIASLVFLGLGLAVGWQALETQERSFGEYTQRMEKASVGLKAYAAKTGHMKELEGPIAYLAGVRPPYAAGVRTGRLAYACSVPLFAAAYFLAMVAPKTIRSFKVILAMVLFFGGGAMYLAALTSPSRGVYYETSLEREHHTRVLADYTMTISDTERAAAGEFPDEALSILRDAGRVNGGAMVNRSLGILMTGFPVFVGFLIQLKQPPAKAPAPQDKPNA